MRNFKILRQGELDKIHGGSSRGVIVKEIAKFIAEQAFGHLDQIGKGFAKGWKNS